MLAGERDWLTTEQLAPDDATIAEALAPAKRAATTVSSLEPHRERIATWLAQGDSGVVIHTVLKREHGFTGHYSAVRRMLDRLKQDVPPKTTVPLNFAPGEAAQVDFGAGPTLEHPAGGMRRTWALVMTFCFSRHQYVEFVWDQTVATWLGCHRRAFESFAAVPARVIIDNAKCAIIKACIRDPEVQRSYADCAEGVKQLWFKATDGMVTIYHDFKPVAAHRRTRKYGDRRTVNDHLPPDAQAFFAHDRAWCLEQADRIGPACAKLIKRLLTDRIVEPLRAAQGVLRLRKSYPSAQLEAACARALAHESPYYRTVKSILAGGHDLRTDDWGAIAPDATPHSGRFARNAASLFAAPDTIQ